ncbi:Aste57867_17599 [Aphanomyces stellatus]|uniref:Aste57867_17599 protein n=1 Tax=Aphanomyces stellatus TaxID=120398 RepID=A0A485L9T0_9STRA|nr:hypothetical protein As57867_017539 [Aphanomyces stellatus]VFT94350.1 Aste57867_17599 [Aphanomyces stellatus]
MAPPPKQPTRPSADRRMSSPSLKASRELLNPGEPKSVLLPRLSTPSPRVEQPSDDTIINGGTIDDEEVQRTQGAELQHCESILSTIQKETTQNGNRYITMLEFKETSNPALDDMHLFVKSMTKELGDLEELCAQGWDNDDIDNLLATIPHGEVASFQHLWRD